MRSIENRNYLSELLFGKTRQAVISLLYLNPEESYHSRGVARLTGLSAGTVHRELKTLETAGIIVRHERHGRSSYQANTACPIYRELRSVIIKTMGVADVLKRELEPLRDRVRMAFVYGSFATGTDTARSGVDVMIIGEVTLTDAVKVLSGAQDIIGREINPAVFPEAEFRRRFAEDEHFVRSVVAEPRILLIGDENELGRLVSGRMDRPA